MGKVGGGTNGSDVSGLPFALRRAFFAILVALTIGGLLWLAAIALSPRGMGVGPSLVLVALAVVLPWPVIGFWNAVIGFLVMCRTTDRAATVTPFVTAIGGDEAITARTAILACIRNEEPERVIRNLAPLLDGIVAAGEAEHFHLFVLSDSDEAHAATERSHFDAFATKLAGRLAFTYRRRRQNTGFKAGNIRDFCERHGDAFDFAIVLDADSVMGAGTVLQLVRIMQACPQIGILQSLVVGMPAASGFARLFQFGMRLGMRSYTLGSAWWQGDCGPYWGHNAVLRLAPFMAHCELPALPTGSRLGEQILSHDQVEAVLMRRAGYEVRVLVSEDDSFEANPPTLIEFLRRDLRWCQGNMQYWHLLGLPGLRPVSRYQLVFALLMFIGSPGWIALLILSTLIVVATPDVSTVLRAEAGTALFVILVIMWFAPKIATIIDVLLRPAELRRFGGLARFSASVVIETAFFILLSPIMWLDHTLFLVRLVAGRTIGWSGQARDDHSVPFADAARKFWPHTLLGVTVIITLALTHPAAIPYALFIAGGLALSIPFAILTARPGFGRLLVRLGIGRLPEETAPPQALAALALPVLAADRPRGTTEPSVA
jgi:membrane glycosyltransferase